MGLYISGISGNMEIMRIYLRLMKLRGRAKRPEYIYILFIPPSFDIISSTLLILPLTMIAATIVGASPLIFKDDEKEQENTNTVLGIALIIIAQFFTPAFMVVEEKLLADYMLHPLKIVGLEGLWGLAIYIMLLIIFQFIECGNKDICPNGRLRYSSGFACNGKNPMIICYAVGSILSVAFYMSLGVTITKYASATQRVTIDVSRTLVIWGVFLAKPGDGHERFIWLQLVGLVILVFGTLFFNEILVLPFLGFNKNTKAAIEERHKLLHPTVEASEHSSIIFSTFSKGKINITEDTHPLLDVTQDNF
ncbi:unnamed protein product [Moneuplotes crassus]|uniref:Uncharacterized protein n=1 Tax=Euplotes crassus TaxID=5936 RepID=A0AAD1UL89_EUPCR|nr:unnamed protein product [Moneuplotes crassus]